MFLIFELMLIIQLQDECFILYMAISWVLERWQWKYGLCNLGVHPH